MDAPGAALPGRINRHAARAMNLPDGFDRRGVLSLSLTLQLRNVVVDGPGQIFRHGQRELHVPRGDETNPIRLLYRLVARASVQRAQSGIEE